jgi:hypothetical protein
MQNVLGTFSEEFKVRDTHWFHNIQSSDKEENIEVKCNGPSAINHLTPNGHFSGRTAPLTYRCSSFYLFNRNMY